MCAACKTHSYPGACFAQENSQYSRNIRGLATPNWAVLRLGVLARTCGPRYRGGVSLRRLRYQLQCARSGHDVRPYMVDGTHVAQKCLRCGAIVDDAEPGPGGEAAPDLVPVRRIEPQPSQLPPAPVERREEAEPAAVADAEVDAAVVTDNGADADEESTTAALAALRELGELHASGVLTDREFARKKAELLRRV